MNGGDPFGAGTGDDSFGGARLMDSHGTNPFAANEGDDDDDGEVRIRLTCRRLQYAPYSSRYPRDEPRRDRAASTPGTPPIPARPVARSELG